MMVTDMRAGPVSPSSIPTPHAMAGCRASLADDGARDSCAPPHRRTPYGGPRGTAPKDSRIIGGAAAPSMDVDTSRSVGIGHPAAEKRKPHAAAMTIGLRAMTVTIPRADGRWPDPARSANTKNIGVKKPS